MLMNINCSTVISLQVDLKFDDNTTKNVIVSKGDLIEVEFNQNGLRRHIEGKVLKISCVGTDPKGWYLIVDSSDDFNSEQAKFSPMNILDIDIIRQADAVRYIETPNDCTGINGLRVIKGRLQYSTDGFNWIDVIKPRHGGFIKDEEGTVPSLKYECENDSIKDEN